MSKTLVTYDDGSEFTTTHFAVAMGLAAIATGASIAISNWRSNRFYRKNNKKFEVKELKK